MKIPLISLISVLFGALVYTGTHASREIIIGPSSMSQPPWVVAVSRAEVSDIRGIVTAYTLGRVEETDDTPCVGASNLDLCAIVRGGGVVYASNGYPLGTVLSVGGKKGVVLDRMARRYTTEIDIAMLDYQEALQFGRQELVVTILK